MPAHSPLTRQGWGLGPRLGLGGWGWAKVGAEIGAEIGAEVGAEVEAPSPPTLVCVQVKAAPGHH